MSSLSEKSGCNTVQIGAPPFLYASVYHMFHIKFVREILRASENVEKEKYCFIIWRGRWKSKNGTSYILEKRKIPMQALAHKRIWATSRLENILDNAWKKRACAQKNLRMDSQILWQRNPYISWWQWDPTKNPEQIEKIEDLLNRNSRSSLHYAAAETGVSRETVYIFLWKHLKMVHYLLPIGTELPDAEKQNSVQFAENCRRGLQNDAR